MPEAWTGELVGKMHCARVKVEELAKELGVTRAYVSLILCGHRKPPEAERKLNEAFERIVSRRESA